MPSLLAGRVVNEQGEPLIASHACKRQVRYRYYVSKVLQQGDGDRDDNSDAAPRGLRIPALELEKVVAEGIASAFDDPLGLVGRAGLTLRADQVASLAASAEVIAGKVRQRERGTVRELVQRVQVLPERIAVELAVPGIAGALGIDPPTHVPTSISIAIDARIKRSGLAVKLVRGNGRLATPAEPQPHLVTLLAKARSWWNEMCEHDLTASDLASRHGVTSSYVTRILRLAFLAPQIVETIIAGEQPPAMDARMLLGLHDLPMEWAQQNQVLLRT